jgi:hypothetical protein
VESIISLAEFTGIKVLLLYLKKTFAQFIFLFAGGEVLFFGLFKG